MLKLNHLRAIKEKAISTVAFTATLPLGFTPVSIGSKVRYNRILLNKGGEYTSGLFTVKTKGLYHVSVSMMSGSVTSHTTLRRNNVVLVWLFTNRNEYDMASQSINLELNVGDVISVQVNTGSNLFSVYNTFSAVCIGEGRGSGGGGGGGGGGWR
ncbi:Hypothetical predicted protein [Mytilus galloprovincialis]|uniref:C1q domain-containing protein n=1 Tax=Mytilus galloprovincialis TaxID=29158 RepID=A0A8B6CIA4_MYTGA|nr:Hypothetical predicted protein [Mytilus galloprovincialis]